MQFLSSDHIDDRFEQINQLPTDTFHYPPLREDIIQDVDSDRQLNLLKALSSRTDRLIHRREKRQDSDDLLGRTIKQFRRALDRAAQRRTDEIITYSCVSLLRRDEYILTKELTTNTQLQVASNGQDQAHRWLDNHEKLWSNWV